jgi:hypothetical protein
MIRCSPAFQPSPSSRAKASTSIRTGAAVIPEILATPIDAIPQLILGIPHLRQQCERIKRAVDLSQTVFECLIETRMDQRSFVRL